MRFATLLSPAIFALPQRAHPASAVLRGVGSDRNVDAARDNALHPFSPCGGVARMVSTLTMRPFRFTERACVHVAQTRIGAAKPWSVPIFAPFLHLFTPFLHPTTTPTPRPCSGPPSTGPNSRPSASTPSMMHATGRTDSPNGTTTSTATAAPATSRLVS